jgi:hypothetical protein
VSVQAVIVSYNTEERRVCYEKAVFTARRPPGIPGFHLSRIGIVVLFCLSAENSEVPAQVKESLQRLSFADHSPGRP